MTEVHAGVLALDTLMAFGVEELFTLSGAHVFPLYDAAVQRDLRLVDVRHESTATFGAEGVAKLTRRPGVAALTAGPGVTNGVSAVTTARFNGSPLVVLGGRAAELGWGRGALQEFDHVPVMAPITKVATTLKSAADIPAELHALVRTALTPHRGPVFADLPLDVIFAQVPSQTIPAGVVPVGQPADPDQVARAAEMIAGAERPAVIAGTDVWWEGAWEPLTAAVETLRVPTFANGLGRGCLPADHELAFSSTRGLLKTEADVVVIVGTPLDFRISFGSFGGADVIHIIDSAEGTAGHVSPECVVAGDIASTLTALADHTGPRADHEPWISRLRESEKAASVDDESRLAADSDPIVPTRIYGELRQRLDRDAVVVCDGGDFVSYAGKYLPSYQPGCWLDPGPFGCLGTGLGYSMAARLVHPDRQVVLLLGDGAAGFSLMDADTLVRQNLPVVIVIGNNGIWGLEKHPMQMLYGYDVAADLQPGIRYDEIVGIFGGAGELVERPDGIGPALDRAFASGVPYVVNVLTDPADAYPRSSNLA